MTNEKPYHKTLFYSSICFFNAGMLFIFGKILSKPKIDEHGLLIDEFEIIKGINNFISVLLIITLAMGIYFFFSSLSIRKSKSGILDMIFPPAKESPTSNSDTKKID